MAVLNCSSCYLNAVAPPGSVLLITAFHHHQFEGAKFLTQPTGTLQRSNTHIIRLHAIHRESNFTLKTLLRPPPSPHPTHSTHNRHACLNEPIRLCSETNSGTKRPATWEARLPGPGAPAGRLQDGTHKTAGRVPHRDSNESTGCANRGHYSNQDHNAGMHLIDHRLAKQKP